VWMPWYSSLPRLPLGAQWHGNGMAKIARSLLVIGCGDTYPQGNRTRLCAVAFSTAPGDRTPNDVADVRLQPVLQERHDFGQNVPRVCMGTKVRHKSIHGVLEDRALDSKCILPCRFFLLAIPSVATMGVCRN
jgi:hypothetical protein